ncbi:MAG: hypothetical protein AAF617_13025 [Bacteroidota bacterium]
MKNSTLLIRSLLVIIVFAGSAHLMTYAADQNPNFTSTDTKFTQSNNKTEDITGRWKVTYNTEEFQGAIVYNIKKEGNKFNAYTFEYQDTNGFGSPAEKTKTLIITSFKGAKGKGVYKLEYEDEIYDVDCTIVMVDENTFRLSYDYYGYSGEETWKRVKS